MTRDDIIKMAKEAGQADGTTPLERSIVVYAAKSSLFLEKFANLVAAAERAACAKVCLAEKDGWLNPPTITALNNVLNGIQSRGEK